MLNNTNIIKFSLLKRHLNGSVELYSDINDALLKHLELAKSNKAAVDNYFRLFSFYIIFFELFSWLNKMVPFCSFVDIDAKDLTKEQLGILRDFSFFLIKFWCDGLKMFVNYLYIEDNSAYLWKSTYFTLISFWLEIPLFLVIFQPILDLDVHCAINLQSTVIADIHEYLCNDPSLFFIFSLWYSHAMDQKDYKDWFNYNLALKSCLSSHFNVPPIFLSYMFILLKESNKNFTFKLEKRAGYSVF